MDIRKQLKDSHSKLNAMVTLMEPENCTVEGKFNGVAIAIKDNFSTKGVLTSACSRILDNYVPIFDATTIEKIKLAGFDCVCKTNMDELGMGGTGLNSYFGPTKNPYDENRITGGSSSGSAGLVGAHIVDYALGTDTGDSVRKPASYTGCVGFKPSYGVVSRYGVIPYASSLDHVAWFTRTVSQSGELLEVLSGRDDKDLTSLVTDFTSIFPLQDNLSGKKIGVIKEIYDCKKDDELKRAFDELLIKLENQGVQIVWLSMDRTLLDCLLSVYRFIANCESTANHSNLDGIRFGHRVSGDDLNQIMMASRSRGFGDLLKKRFVIGAYGLDDAHQEDIFRKSQRVRRKIVEKYLELLGQVDAILLPASNSIAPTFEQVKNLKTSGDDQIIENHLVLSNFAGTPSITIPLGFSQGCPFGVNLSSLPLSEKSLLGLAKGIEDIINFSELEKEVNPWNSLQR